MDQEQLIRQIMAEVMKELGSDEVKFEKTTAAPSNPASSAAPSGGVSAAQYPLAESMPEKIKSSTGKPLTEFTISAVKSGELEAGDLRISSDTLEMQAQVAESVGRDALARNMRRAAELITVPDDRLLAIYNALRPYRSTKQELFDIADELDQKYGAKINAGFVRQAANVYESRGRLRQDD